MPIYDIDPAGMYTAGEKVVAEKLALLALLRWSTETVEEFGEAIIEVTEKAPSELQRKDLQRTALMYAEVIEAVTPQVPMMIAGAILEFIVPNRKSEVRDAVLSMPGIREEVMKKLDEVTNTDGVEGAPEAKLQNKEKFGYL